MIIQNVITIGAGIASEMEVRELNELLNYLNNYAKNRKNKQRFSAIMVCLAIIVSFTVSVGLIEPAESASGELICGMEEHEHTQDCFELICGFDEETEEEIVVETTVSDSEKTTESSTLTEETATADTEPATTDTETIISTCTDESVPAPVHIHNDECYRLICLTEAHLHKKECYNQPAETEPAATEIFTSTSTSTSTGTTTEQTTETTTTATELSEEVYELTPDTFGEFYKDRVDILADDNVIWSKVTEDENGTLTVNYISECKFYYEGNALYVKDANVNGKFDYVDDKGASPEYYSQMTRFDLNYNGYNYNYVYNLNNAGRFISFTAPENGKLIFVLNSDAYTINLSVNGNEDKNLVFTNTGEPNIIEISVAKGNTYTIKQSGGTGKARLAYAEFIPAVKTEESKFYYGDEKILHYNECFSYPDGTDGPNANTVTPKVGVVYNGVTYNNAYNFNKTDARYITLKAPKDGTLFMAFDGGTYNINVLKTGDTEPKSYSCNNTDQNVIAVPVLANGEYKIYQNSGNDNARLAYAEFIPVPEAGKVYRIIDVKTGKYVELSGDNIELGGETPSGDLSNDFKLTDAGNGYFNIYPQSIENKVIDYERNNNNIHIYNSNSNDNQQFHFILNDDGTYKIKSPGYENSYWKVDENNDIKTSVESVASNFQIIEATEIVYPKADIDTTKTYLIKNVRSRLYMHRNVYEKDSKGNVKKDADGNPIVESPNSTDLVQWKDISIYSQFTFEKMGDGKYKIKNGNDYISVESVGFGADADLKSGYDEFYAEQMPNGSIRFYQINENGKKLYLEIEGEAINDGANIDLWEADRVKENQCFFLVPVIEPEIVDDEKTRIEARVIFGDYNDGKITINDDGTITDTRKRYDEPAYIPTFNLYGANKIDEQKGNLVVDISIARKDWCYQYNYVWYQNKGSEYYVELDGVENKQITYNGKTFKVYYLHDDELGHPGNAPSDAYRTDPSDLKVDGDQVVYIFLDPIDDRPNAEKFSLTMKKRWDGYNQEGYKNRPKEKIRVQLQHFDNGSNTWKKFEQDGYMNWYYYEVKNGDTEYKVNKNSVGITDYIYYKAGTLYTDKECKTEYKDLGKLNYTYLSSLNTNNGTIKHLNPNVADRLIVKIVDSKEWNDILLTAGGENNPQHFKDGYYYIWNDLPVGDYRVVETQSFYDEDDDNKLDVSKGDRDTSHDYYYMSFPPSRDSSGVLHIQNFTKDMVIEVQKKWQDDKGGDMTLKNPIEFEVYRCLGDPRNSVPENPEFVGKFKTNENGYAFITSREYDSNFDENSQGNGYYYGVLNMETKNGDTKYHYFIKEIVPDGYRLINGNEKGYVWRAGIDADSETKDYAIDYEDGDSRKFIITNKAKIGLRVEKEWYYNLVSDANKIDYYNNNTDNPIYPKFRIYKGDRPGTPVVNGNTYSVNDVELERIAEATIGTDGYFELISVENDKHGDSSYVNDKLNMLSDTKYELVSTGFDGNIFRNASDYPANIQGDYIVVDGTNRFWVGSNKTKNNQVKAPYITGTLTLEFENYDENSILSVGNRCNMNGVEYNEAKYYNIKDANGVVSIPGLYVDGNYRIMGYNCTLNIKKVTFTHDAYYYIQEITNDNSNYTLSNGNDNGFVEVSENVYYTTITANNHYPVVTAQNIPKVKLDITKEWTPNNENISKVMNFEIYKAFANGEPVADDKGYKVTVNNSDYQLTKLSGEYKTDENGNLNVADLAAFEKGSDGKYHKLYYYVREVDGNYTITNTNAKNGFIPYESVKYGTAFDDTSSDSGKYNFVNKPKFEITVEKTWLDEKGNEDINKAKTEIKFELYRKIGNGTSELIKDGENNFFITEKHKKLIQNLDAYDENGNIYTYYIKEIDGETYFISGFNVKYNEQTNPEECAFSWNKNGEKHVINITNQAKPQNYELPETGGSGTHGCTAAGGTIFLLSAAVLLLKRRKKMV